MTALQQALKRLNYQIETLEDIKEHAVHADAVLRFLKQERMALTELLEQEKEQIFDAYELGHMEGLEGFQPDKADCYKHIAND